MQVTPIAQSAGGVEHSNSFSAEGKDPLRNEYPGYETKQSDGEVPVMVELWGVHSTSSIPSLPGPLDSGPVYGSNKTKLRTYAKLNCLK